VASLLLKAFHSLEKHYLVSPVTGLWSSTLNEFPRQNSALHVVCQKGHMEIVPILLAAGATLVTQDNVSLKYLSFRLKCLQEGMTPLHIACERGHVEMVNMFLAAGAPLEARDQVS
jgi:ankyrin repeat protein